MFQEKSLETNTKEGVLSPAGRIGDLIPGFLKYARYEIGLSPETVGKYRESLLWVIRDLGDLPAGQLTPLHFTDLKEKIARRGAGESRVASIVFALKSFLKFCREFLRLDVLDYKLVKAPKRQRREVLFLTNEEVKQFIDSIKLETLDGRVSMNGLRFRTLVEVLLGTGMRISEALSLDRDMIDFAKGEAKIVGKGNKERTVFFTERALHWIKLYLEHRADTAKPLFITHKLTRMARCDMSNLFKNYVKHAGLDKKITPHILRHTVATNLLFNGCPISHVKEILGHERLETTCHYYLGVDKRKAKEAHGKYLSF